MVKICRKCNKQLSIIMFRKKKGTDCYYSYCNDCVRLMNYKRYLTVKDTSEWKDMQKKASKKNRIKLKLRRINDPKFDEFYRKYRAVYEKKYKSSDKGIAVRRKNDLKRLERPENRLHNNVARLLRYALCESKGKCRTEDILGYPILVLKNHLEKQFTKNMTWDNYGSYWHIDHIKPRSWFTPEQIKECWALDNLRPLSARENIIKRDRWEIYPNVFLTIRK